MVNKRFKIIFYFLSGIGLPSILLGYLAFRGIMNDRSLVEKELLNRCSEIAANVEQSFDDHYRSFASDLYQHFIPEIEKNPRYFASIQSHYPLIDALFIINRSGDIQFPFQKLLYISDGNSNKLAENSPDSRSSVFQKGQEYEFVHQKHEEALQFYQIAYNQNDEPHIKAGILNAICRIRKKSSQWDEAIQAYRILASDFGHISLVNGVPAKIIAQLETGSIYLKKRNPSKALVWFRMLYTDMIRGVWKLEKSVYDFIHHKLKKSLDQTIPQIPLNSRSTAQDSLDKLDSLDEQRRKNTDHLLAFLLRARHFLVEDESDFFPSEERSYQKVIIETAAHETYLVLLLNTPDSRNRKWGILLDKNHLKSTFLPSVIKKCIKNDPMLWAVRDESGHIVIKKEDTRIEKPFIQIAFANRFPPWILELSQQDTGLFQTLFYSRRSIYFLMFLLIGCVLVFGLFFTYRALRHEMELIRIKSDFVTAVSHEFKNPLTSIRQLSEMLQSDRVPTESRRRQYYNVLVQQSDRLRMMANNILDYTKMEKGKKKFTFEMVNPGNLIQRTVTEAQNRMLHTNFEIYAEIFTDLPFLKADPEALEQMLANLIDNAIKFSDKKQRIEISAIHKKGEIVISVQDWGIGMDETEIEKIFQQFYRSQNPQTKRTKGSGLGLTLAKQIIDAHGGTIEVRSKPGKGSTFFIHLPCSKN